MSPRRTHLNLILFGQHDGYADLREQTVGRDAGSTLDGYVDFARRAERAKLDAFFKADFLGFDKEHIHGDPSLLIEPLALVASLVAVTERIGLVTTASTTFFEPFNVARQVASLHNLSGGRAGWNAVTSFNGEANFGGAGFDSPAERYERATEFIEVVLQLWDSWDADALQYAAGARPSVDPSRIRDIEHAGAHYQVRHALDVSRLVAERPVVFQAGASPEGVRFAARYGEAIFVATPDLRHAHEYYDRVKGLAEEFGRHPDSVRVLPGVRTYIRDTEQEAIDEYHEAFEQENYYSSRLAWIAREAPFFDLAGVELDEVIPADRIPTRERLEGFNRRISRGLLLRDLVSEVEGVTLRQFLHRIHGFAHLDVVGTPEQVAGVFQQWFDERASDGFTLHGGNSFERFTEQVLPILRERGRFREEYEGTTLRHHLGLDG